MTFIPETHSLRVSAAFRPVNRDLGIYAVHRLDKLVLNSLALPQKSKS